MKAGDQVIFWQHPSGRTCLWTKPIKHLVTILKIGKIKVTVRLLDGALKVVLPENLEKVVGDG